MAAEELAGRIGQTAGACEALGVARSTLYRWRRPVTSRPKRRPRPHRALDETEREQVLGALHSARFVDKAPAAVWATLLDQGIYYCSVRTMYRVLAEHEEVRERRNQLRHPNYRKPELLAEAPNQVWSWDITKLRGPVKWTYYYLEHGRAFGAGVGRRRVWSQKTTTLRPEDFCISGVLSQAVGRILIRGAGLANLRSCASTTPISDLVAPPLAIRNHDRARGYRPVRYVH